MRTLIIRTALLAVITYGIPVQAWNVYDYYYDPYYSPGAVAERRAASQQNVMLDMFYTLIDLEQRRILREAAAEEAARNHAQSELLNSQMQLLLQKSIGTPVTAGEGK